MNLRSAGASGPPWLGGTPAPIPVAGWERGPSPGPLGLDGTRFEQRPRQRGRALEQCGTLLRVGACQRRLEQLSYDAERELLLDVAAARAQDPHPGLLGHVSGRLQTARSYRCPPAHR